MKAYGGITVDHLYSDCPSMKKAHAAVVHGADGPGVLWVGRELITEVDPMGTDICGWCRRVWKARKP